MDEIGDSTEIEGKERDRDPGRAGTDSAFAEGAAKRKPYDEKQMSGGRRADFRGA